MRFRPTEEIAFLPLDFPLAIVNHLFNVYTKLDLIFNLIISVNSLYNTKKTKNELFDRGKIKR